MFRLAIAIVAAVLAVSAADSRARAQAGAPIEVLEPTSGYVVTDATVVLRVRSHPGDSLLVAVSKSATPVDPCGRIGFEIAGVPFRPTEADPGVYEVVPPASDLPSYWLRTPGVYYWQAYRIEPSGGCTTSAVRSIVVAGTVPNPPPAKPGPQPKPKPKPRPQPKPAPVRKPATARLAGRFVVQERVIKSVGFHERPGVRSDDVWVFVPRCARGACSVGLVFTVRDTIRIELSRSSGTYVGHGSGRLATCHGRRVAGDIDVRLSVTSAATVSSVWRVTRWTGTIRTSVPDTVVGRVICHAGALTERLTGVTPSF